MTSHSIKERIINLVLVAGSVLIALLLIEILLKSQANDKWRKTKEANVLRNLEVAFDPRNLYDSGIKNSRYRRDQYGLRGSCQDPSDIAVLTVGGSTTDQRYLEHSSTFQAQLEDLLLDKKGKKVCISNAGVDGHSTYGHLFAFEHWFPLIEGLKPTYVLLYIGINDANFTQAGPLIGYDVRDDGDWRQFFSRSAIVQDLTPLYRRIRDLFEGNTPKYAGHKKFNYLDEDYSVTALRQETDALVSENTVAFRARLSRILQKIALMSATPVCVTQPHLYVKNFDGELRGVPDIFTNGYSGLDFDYALRAINQVIKEMCGANTIDLADLDLETRHFYDGVHMTPSGAKLIANVMYQDFFKDQSFGQP